MQTAPASTLDEAPAGTEAIVCGIAGGRELTARLVALGLTEGARLKVLQNAGRGPMLVLVRDTRLAIGRGEATRIRVRPGAE